MYQRIGFKRAIAAAALAAMSITGFGEPARAQSGGGLNLIRDAEIEATIRAFATPIWADAGLQPDAVTINLVNDRTLNAYVAGGQNMFVHTGLLLRADNAGQLLGVLAHETGHIAHGDLAKIPGEMRAALITSLLSIVAGAAAAASTGQGSGVNAGILAGQSLAERNFFAFSRGVEAAADQAGVNFLDDTHMSSAGFLRFMEVLQHQELLSTNRQDPYLRTHPLTLERIEFLRNHAATSPWTSVPVPADYADRFDRMRAKLWGFLDPPEQTLRRFPAGDHAVTARYARAIAYYREADLPRALPLIDGLIAEEPNNPWFQELKGQMLFENGKVADAVAPYARAVELAPTSALLRVESAQVRIETENPALLKPAVADLIEASHREHDMPLLWNLLAIGYGRDGQLGQAAVAQAEGALLDDRFSRAREEARKAMRLLPVGSPGWQRAQDIESDATNAIKKRE